MNQVSRKILDNVVNPALNALGSMRVGRIISRNATTNEAEVSFSSASGLAEDTEKSSKYVAMVRQEGMYEAGPFVGDEVLLGFINNDISRPVILGAIDTRYAISRRPEREGHKGSGTNIADYYTRRSGANWNVERFRL